MSPRQGERYLGPYEVLMSRPVYENPSLTVREDDVQHRSGEKAKLAVVDMKPAVAVLPMDEDGTTYLVREFKYALRGESLEAVSGAIESGESPEQAGLREIGEEVGLVASEWIDLGTVHPVTTVIHAPNHMFLARKLSSLRRTRAPSERLEIVTLPFEEVLQAVLRGEITHAASCVLVLKAQHFLSRRGGR